MLPNIPSLPSFSPIQSSDACLALASLGEATTILTRWVGVVVLVVGGIYLVTVGRSLLPKADLRNLSDQESELFVVELSVPEGSPISGKSLEASGFPEQAVVEVQKLVRGGRAHVRKAREIKVQPGDVLLVRGTLRHVMDLIKSGQVVVLSDFGETRRVRSDGRLVRTLLRNRTVFNGRTGAEVDFWRRYRGRLIGLEVESIGGRRLADEELHVGEIALIEISRTALDRLRRSPDLFILEELEDDFDLRRMVVAMGIVGLVVTLAAFTPLPIVLTALMGVIAMVLTGTIDADDIYLGVPWDVVFLLAGIIPLGIAMAKSGAADWIAGLLASHTDGWHPLLVLVVLYLITTLMTELVSNNASVIILVPVTVSLARGLGLEVFPMILTVMFAASTSFLSPIGYQTNTMIYGTGVCRFTDFAKVGAPLNALLAMVTPLTIWLIWPLAAG